MKFFKPTILLTRILIAKTDFGFVAYQPKFLARQFGFSHFLPKSIFTKDDEMCLTIDTPIEAYYKECLYFNTKKFINLKSLFTTTRHLKIDGMPTTNMLL